MQQIREYVNYKELPVFIAKRINWYYEYTYNQEFYREQTIMSTISPRLKQDVALSTCRHLLENVSFFRSLPRSVLARLAKLMKRETFLPNDVIVCAGTQVKAMYLIAAGTVAVYDKNGKEVVANYHYVRRCLMYRNRL